jgi:hypothetical protein
MTKQRILQLKSRAKEQIATLRREIAKYNRQLILLDRAAKSEKERKRVLRESIRLGLTAPSRMPKKHKQLLAEVMPRPKPVFNPNGSAISARTKKRREKLKALLTSSC